MEELDTFRQNIRTLIQEYAQFQPARGDVLIEVVELVKAGIRRDRIVLAFKHPTIRPHTDYAVS